MKAKQFIKNLLQNFPDKTDEHLFIYQLSAAVNDDACLSQGQGTLFIALIDEAMTKKEYTATSRALIVTFVNTCH